MGRPVLLIHGYSASGLDFKPLCAKLVEAGISAIDLNIGNYVSLNNEITIKDIAEGLGRAFRMHPALNQAEEFDAIVHSTGMLVVRSWLTNYGAAPGNNERLKRLKHLIGLAPATWGSPQAHKGRTWLGTLVKGDKTPGPDFLNAGDEVLFGLELGSTFTWDLALTDLVGPAPYYGKGPNTPYVTVFVGNRHYEGLSSVANDPGTDGTVRWAGCGLNTRKITLDLTKTPIDKNGNPRARATITPWAVDRLDIPIIAVEGRNHATLVSDPDEGMVSLLKEFLSIEDEGAHSQWLEKAKTFGQDALKRMLIDPGRDAAGAVGEIKASIENFFHIAGRPIEGWQQFVVRARDEHGDPVTDYLIEVLHQENGEWVKFDEMYTDVHPYARDLSFRCFHVRLPQGACSNEIPMRIRVHASTGTALVVYQGYGTSEIETNMRADSAPVDIDLGGFGENNRDSLFHPFTTTMVEIVLNREPYPLNDLSPIFTFLANV